jgi:diguanylate cyclase (GGDEF)-like protein
MSAMLTNLGYDVVAETDARNVLSILRAGEFDVVLVDIVMPNLNGLDLIDQIREHWNILPILVVTAYGSAELTVDAMRRGATDFVTKPVDGALIDLRIRRAFDLEQTRRMANTDGLTGLYNHRHLQERLQQEIVRTERYKRPLSVIMGDLDQFKGFNDAFGHPRGDELLIEVARTLRKLSRASDILARYGGEEFTLVLPETSAEDARVLAERVRQCVADLDCGEAAGAKAPDPSHTDPRSKVTLSLGVAAHVPGNSKEVLIEAADAALYQAKRAGRNRVVVAGDDPDAAGATPEQPLRLVMT